MKATELITNDELKDMASTYAGLELAETVRIVTTLRAIEHNRDETQNKLAGQEFYELMQAYRNAPAHDQEKVATRYNTVIEYLKQTHHE